jgi:hypothetical protein
MRVAELGGGWFSGRTGCGGRIAFCGSSMAVRVVTGRADGRVPGWLLPPVLARGWQRRPLGLCAVCGSLGVRVAAGRLRFAARAWRGGAAGSDGALAGNWSARC